MNIELSTGDLEMDCGEILGNTTLKSSTGEFEIANSSFKSLSAESSSGDVSFENVTLSGKLTMKLSSASFEFSRLDAAEISIKSSSGDVEGSMVRPMNFQTYASSGKVRVPASDYTAGLCSISTSSGDIEISLGRFDD